MLELTLKHIDERLRFWDMLSKSPRNDRDVLERSIADFKHMRDIVIRIRENRFDFRLERKVKIQLLKEVVIKYWNSMINLAKYQKQTTDLKIVQQQTDDIVVELLKSGQEILLLS